MSAAGAAEPVAASSNAHPALHETQPPSAEPEDEAEPAVNPEEEASPSVAAPEAPPEPIKPVKLSGAAVGAVVNRLPTWTARWSELISGFAPRRFILVEREQVGEPGSDATQDARFAWPYDLEFARRHKNLFRPSPDGALWADVYVATFGLGSEEPLQAHVGDTSYLTVMNPQTGDSRVLWVLGIACGFDDALWLEAHKLLAVGSCLDGGKQRPFVARVDLKSLVLERFDYPVAATKRFDTERYIRHRNPQIRF